MKELPDLKDLTIHDVKPLTARVFSQLRGSASTHRDNLLSTWKLTDADQLVDLAWNG